MGLTDVVYTTSGSTGEPKGSDRICKFNRICRMDGITMNQKVHKSGSNQAPFSFDLSVMAIYPCLTSGGHF